MHEKYFKTVLIRNEVNLAHRYTVITNLKLSRFLERPNFKGPQNKYFYPKFIEFKVGLLKAVPIILKNLALICGHTACILSVLTILNVVNLKSFCKKINEFKDRLNTNVIIVWQNVSCFVVIFLNVFLL